MKVAYLERNMIRLSGIEPEVDIKIKYVGLLPGEKFYEELLHQSKDDIHAHHPKVMIVRVREQNLAMINISSNTMTTSLKIQNSNEIVKIMKVISPEFIRHNAVYGQLDSITKF